MTFFDLMQDTVGLTLVHWDQARGLACFWNGSVVFLEYSVNASGAVKQLDSWGSVDRPTDHKAALEVARRHYRLSPD